MLACGVGLVVVDLLLVVGLVVVDLLCCLLGIGWWYVLIVVVFDWLYAGRCIDYEFGGIGCFWFCLLV